MKSDKTTSVASDEEMNTVNRMDNNWANFDSSDEERLENGVIEKETSPVNQHNTNSPLTSQLLRKRTEKDKQQCRDGPQSTVNTDKMKESTTTTITSDLKSNKHELRDSIAGSNKKGGEEPTIRLLELAHEIVKEVFDRNFHLVLSLALLVFQSKNSMKLFRGGKITEDDDLMIVIGVAFYGICTVILVTIHVLFLVDQDTPTAYAKFKWTRIPIFDSLLEIPVCLWYAPFTTLFLWLVCLACCAGLIYITVEQTVDHDDKKFDLSAFALNACLVAFDLYRLTGKVAQYCTVIKSANFDAHERDKQVVNVIASYLEEDV